MITYTLLQLAAMARAQAAYDHQEPPDNHDCKVDGHKWHRLPGHAPDGTCFAKCTKCGVVEECP